MKDEPVVLLEGGRTVGKSTLLRELASKHSGRVLDLDDLATRDAVASDPATFLAGDSPVLIDEYQHLPEVLDVIKAELNKNSSPGRFVITGSSRHSSLPAAAQALTGRLHRIPIYPLSQAEIDESSGDLVDKILRDPTAVVSRDSSRTNRAEYIDRVVAGGLPSPLARESAAGRQRWFDDYIRLTLERDVQGLSRIQQATALPQVLDRLAGQTAQILNVTNIASGTGQNARTVDSYIRLLEAVFLVYRLPAWGTTLTSRASARPKIHVTDSGITARLLRLSSEKLAKRSAAALTELGHLFESFAVGELLRQASWHDGISAAGHWRTRDGDEVDLVLERDDGTVIAFEIKASQRMSGPDLGPLRKFRDAVGETFTAGYALYLGERSYTAEDRIHVLPADRLWTQPGVV